MRMAFCRNGLQADAGRMLGGCWANAARMLGGRWADVELRRVLREGARIPTVKYLLRYLEKYRRNQQVAIHGSSR
jgi:hypothetical protein